ncbi:MAG: CRTAC1 family protein [Candidatus Zipacnadales bacterium]
MGLFSLLVMLVFGALTLAQPKLRFTDVSAETGMWRVPTSWGLTAVDVDGDRDLDLLMANNGSENAIFFNEGHLRFRGQPLLGGAAGTEALVPGDVNGDGKLDLLACVWGGPSSLLLGDGTGWFEDLTEPAGLPLVPAGRCGGAALADLDADGDLDLYFPDGERGDALFLNSDGVFHDVTEEVGLPQVAHSECALAADFDDDGWLDVYVPRYDTTTSLYLNQGKGRLKKLSATSEVFAAPRQLGACAFDADKDGDLDLLCTAGRFNTDGAPLRLLSNCGQGQFVDATPKAWLEQPHRHHTACTGDVDNDGDLDVFDSTLEGCSLWLNDGTGQFTPLTDEPGWGKLPGAGVLMCDLDNDGDLDVVLRARPSEIPTFGEYVFRNELNNENWLKVRPIDKRGNRFCHGAQVRIYEAGQLGNSAHLVARADLTSLNGWCCYGPLEAHFGLDARKRYDVEVRFTDSTRATAEAVATGQTLELE